MPNIRILDIEIVPGETCSGFAYVGQPTEDPLTDTRERVFLGDIITEDEHEKLGHRETCAFHRGQACDFKFQQE